MGHAEKKDSPEHLAIYAAHLSRLVARMGIDEATLLEGTGLVPDDLVDPDHRIPDRAMNALVVRAIELTREPGLGFHMGLQVKLSAHGAVGFAAMTAATLGDAIAIAERFFALRAGHVEIAHEIDGEWATLEVVERFPLGHLEVFVMESLLTGLAQMAQMLIGVPLQGSVEVRYPEPKHFRGFAHLWPGPARFSRRANRLLFSRAYLDMPLTMADDFASREAIARCEAELATLGEKSSLITTVRKQIRNRNRGFLSLTELADLRGVSTRTLKRNLAAHGTSFQALLDELRRDRAIELLDRPGYTVEQVAEALGYADTANFRRAFHRWVGCAPSAFRGASATDDEGPALSRATPGRAPRAAAR